MLSLWTITFHIPLSTTKAKAIFNLKLLSKCHCKFILPKTFHTGRKWIHYLFWFWQIIWWIIWQFKRDIKITSCHLLNFVLWQFHFTVSESNSNLLVVVTQGPYHHHLWLINPKISSIYVRENMDNIKKFTADAGTFLTRAVQVIIN